MKQVAIITWTFSFVFLGRDILEAKTIDGKPERLGKLTKKPISNVWQVHKVLIGLDCCPVVRVSSGSIGSEVQSEKMGIYKAIKGKLNNRRVFKHVIGKLIH